MASYVHLSENHVLYFLLYDLKKNEKRKNFQITFGDTK